MSTELVGAFRQTRVLVTGQRSFEANDVRLKGGVVTDFPSTGAKVMPAGAVVVKKTADGLYYLANDASNGDRNTAAVVTSDQAAGAGWDSKVFTWTLRVNGIITSGTITAGGSDDSTSKHVTLWNANIAFRAIAIASGTDGNPLVLTTLAKGDVSLTVSENVAAHAAFGGGAGLAAGTTASGVEADYRVTNEQRQLVDMNGAARDSNGVPSYLAGHFDESELTALTVEAKAVFLKRGSIFG